MKETKKVKEKNFSKGKGKGNVEKNHIHQEAAGPGHNSGPPHTLFRINIDQYFKEEMNNSKQKTKIQNRI